MRRSIPLVAAALGLSLTLTACSSDGDDTTSTPAPTTPAATESSEAPQGGELTIWVDETRQAPVEAAAAAFKEETGATVTLVQKNFGDIRGEFVTQVPTGEGPDITIGAHDWLGELTANGVVAPIELGEKASQFEELAIDAVTYDGQIYGLPYAIENLALIRNTELAPEAPATWDDMVKMGEDAGTEYKTLIQVGEEGDPFTMYPLQTSFGAEVFTQSDDGAYTTELALGGENGAAFATWLAEQAEAGVIDDAVTYDVALASFAEGKSPFIIGGPWMIEAFQDLDLAIDPIPTPGDQPASPFLGVPSFFVSAQSDNQILAVDFLTNYMATEDAQIALFEAGYRTPALTAAADAVSSDPIVAGFRAVGENALPMPAIPEMGAVWTFWGKTEAQIINGGDPVALWEKMVADIQGELDK